MFCVLKWSTRIVDPGSSFRMRRLWRLWRHELDILTLRHQCRHQSTRRRHFPIGSLLGTNPQFA